MREVIEWLEAFFLVTILGIVALLGAAFLLHTAFDKREFYTDLSMPPSHLVCTQDPAGHCWIQGK